MIKLDQMFATEIINLLILPIPTIKLYVKKE